MGIIQPFKSKKQTDTTKAGGYSHGDFPMSDFIPYAVFFNDHTLLTKNGELVQTISIPLSAQGLPSEEAIHTGVYLRDVIRNAIKTHITSPDISHWLHVFRDRDAITPLSQPPSEFAATLHTNWLESQHTSYSYHNSCYLTLVVQGQSADLFDLDDFRKANRKQKNRRYREQYLEEQYAKLDQVMHAIMADIAKHFQVKRLGMVERVENNTPVYYSEQLEWLHRLINLDEEDLPVSEADISQQLETSNLIFGFDAMEARHKKHKRFASVISLKHYHELPVELFDRFLQLPVEMVITQASHFVASKKALSELESIRKVLKRSEDGYIAEQSGFIDVVEANQGHATDFAQQQTTIMIMTDDYHDLDHTTNKVQKAISDLGLLTVREDIKMEEIFWSQLPGNFEFLRRAQILPSNKMDGFARLNYYPTGKAESHWGEPITILPTATQTPYLFHFHQGQVGHSLVADFNSFPDAIGQRLVHFLCAAASKQTKRIIMFDRHGSGEMFTKAMGGTYLRLGGRQHNLSLNPLAMECVPGNQGFLAAWLALLLNVDPEDTAARDSIRACIGQGWDANAAKEGYAHLVQMMQQVNPSMADALRSLMQQPVFGACVASNLDNLQLDAQVLGINMHMDAFDEQTAVVLFSLMLHRTILTLDGEPTLLVVKDAWDVLDHPFFASRLNSLFDMLTERNAALLLTSRKPEQLPASAISPIVLDAVTTTCVIPDDIPCDYLASHLGYSATEEEQLRRMERQKGEFLVVHGDEMITTQLQISDARQQAILSGDMKTLQAMRNV